MALVSDVLRRARDILQDAAGTRYLDAELCMYVEDGVQQARSVRPDLFIGQITMPIMPITSPTAMFPLPDQFIMAMGLYAAGRAEIRDDEFAVDGRAMSLLSSLTSKLMRGM